MLYYVLTVQQLLNSCPLRESCKQSGFFLVCFCFSEIDYLRSEKSAAPVTCDSIQSSLAQVPDPVPDDNGKYLDIKSSVNGGKHGETEEKKPFTESQSRTSKEDPQTPLPIKERANLPSCSPSNKPAIHFDKPNRLVI